MDSQSVKTTEESGGIKGYDGGKQVKGRKRHVLVDTLGLLLSVEVTPAHYLRPGRSPPLADRAQAVATTSGAGSGLMDPTAAHRLPPGVRPKVPGGWRSSNRLRTSRGLSCRPWCWIVERTLGWLGRQRRLSKDYERKLQTSETLLKLAMIRLMLRRLARSSE